MSVSPVNHPARIPFALSPPSRSPFRPSGVGLFPAELNEGGHPGHGLPEARLNHQPAGRRTRDQLPRLSPLPLLQRGLSLRLPQRIYRSLEVGEKSMPGWKGGV